MSERLSGKFAFITGAARGQGDKCNLAMLTRSTSRVGAVPGTPATNASRSEPPPASAFELSMGKNWLDLRIRFRRSISGATILDSTATLLPEQWLEPAAAGTAQQCVARIRKELDYGADAVILHGCTPDELEPIVTAYRNGDQ